MKKIEVYLGVKNTTLHIKKLHDYENMITWIVDDEVFSFYVFLGIGFNYMKTYECYFNVVEIEGSPFDIIQHYTEVRNSSYEIDTAISKVTNTSKLSIARKEEIILILKNEKEKINERVQNKLNKI